MVDDPTFLDDVEGYCTPLSCRQGEVVSVHLSSRRPSVDVVVERWGAERVPVWTADAVPVEFVPPPPDADAAGCGWPATLEIEIPTEWRPGFYLVTLTAPGAPEGRAVAHAGFVVRAAADAPRPAALLVLATNTWNAYNNWGGRSLYTGASTVSFARPFGRGMLCRPRVERDDRKSRPVRTGEEPDADGAVYQAYRAEHGYPAAIGSAGWFTHERPFVEWAEAAGYEFDYAISTDLDADDEALDGYRLVVSVGHDEYWSAGQRASVERHVASGGHLATFSGNTMFWRVRPTVTPAGPAMTCHKYRAHLDDPVVAAGRPEEMTGMWADPLVGRPEWSLLGAGSAFGLYHRFGRATPRGVGGFVVYRADHWMLAATGMTYGDVLGADHGVVGYETVGCPIAIDELQLPVAAERDGLPADIEIVALTPSSNLGMGDYPASISALSDQGDLEFVATRLYGDTSPDNLARVRHGNAVMLTCRPFGATGGEVVTVGSTDWVFGLGDPAVSRVTSNVLDRLLA